MSIVLVIIGLIVAGITVGQSLTRAAELRSIISDFKKYQVAVNTYKLQYDALPGDHRTAQDYWPTQCVDASGNTCNGDGDGQVVWTFSSGHESFRFWQHLVLAEMLDGIYSGRTEAQKFTIGKNLPKSAIDNAGFFAGNGTIYGKIDNYISIAAPVQNGNGFGGPVLNTPDVHSIDKKIDDGIADKGNVVTINGWVGGSYPSSGCVTAAPTASAASYDFSNTEIKCAIYFYY